VLLTDVILPLPLNSAYTYIVPVEYENVSVGCRVIVQFGKKKYYTAIVIRVYEGNATDETKEIVSVLDEKPIILGTQLEFWQWLSFYYMCTLGEVLRAALPSALKLESETFVRRIDSFLPDKPLTPTEQQIFLSLSDNHSMKISDIGRKLKINNIVPHIKSLVDKGAIQISENLKDNYSPKTQTRVRLSRSFSEEELLSLLGQLKRAKRQQFLLSVFLDSFSQAEDMPDYSILKKDLLEKASVSSTVLDALIDRGIIEVFEEEISRFNYGKSGVKPISELNIHQQKAYDQIQEEFKVNPIVLLHGVTSSGKTEIYIQLIKKAIDEGKQVLYLLPEIALTTQITERLKSVFGDKLLVYHSKFNDNERAEVWNSLLSGKEGQVILGARSAVFLPFRNLGLIIVDEEHESSYKQQDPAPRYNARNAAIILGNICRANVLLGTATPSIESYNNALSGKYGLVALTHRHGGVELPKVETVDVKLLKCRKQMKSVLSPPLIAEINKAFSKEKQVILFQNRRGFSPSIECSVCAWTPRCEHCDVSLTYHKGQRMMACHYCGATYGIPDVCPDCKTPTLGVVGYGTERIEEEVQELFPDKNVVRMDLDTTRSKRAYERIISGLENRTTDILIGTQMVSKGLDFDNVTTVGILNADSLLNYPDFRAHEKAFQMMTQVSGRAGRKSEQGMVMLQTSQPQHPVISCVVNNSYKKFYDMQITERQLFYYPPFCRLIAVVLKGKEEAVLNEASQQFAQVLRKSFNERVLGPTKPVISRIQSLHIRTILLKINNQSSPQKVRDAIRYYHQHIFEKPEFRSLIVYYDVDPLI